MKQSELNYAIRQALKNFDEWNDITGTIIRCTSKYDELTGIIEDAVTIGVEVALGVYKTEQSKFK